MKRQIFIIALSSAVLAMLFTLGGLDRDLEHLTLDLRFKLFPDTASACDSIVLIEVDNASLESLDWLGWPWPRQIWSDLTGFLFDSGAEVVYFDITFPTSSTFSATEDSIFGAAAGRGKTVFITGLGRQEGQPIPDKALLDIVLPCDTLPYRFASPPVEDIASGAAMLASPYAYPDPDGLFRQFPLLFPAENGAVPSPPLACAMLFMNEMHPEYSNGELSLAGNTYPLTDEHELQVRFAGPSGTYASLSVSDVFKAMTGDTTAVPPDFFNGRIVMIGYTSSDLMDLKPTPYSPRCPGVEVIANTTGNILQNRYLHTHGKLVTLFLVLALSLAVASAMLFIRRVIPAFLAGLLLIFLFAGVSLFLFRGWDIWLETIPPLTAGFLTLLAGAVVAYQYTTREKRFLKAAFSQYLSPEVVSQVAANPGMLKLRGEKRTMTAFFSDVAGFTTISEKLDPKDLVSLLNLYLTEMTDIILSSGGTVDKFEGDAIIAFWGAPVEYEDHAERGVRTALECQRKHIELNRGLLEQGFPELHTRMGLASGPMVVGNMGSVKRFDYTMMGTDVNLASRLEGVNKVYGTKILIADRTRKELPEDMICREIDTVMVVGQKTPVTVWEPCLKKEDWFDTYAEALGYYRNGEFERALGLFVSIPDDSPSREMSRRCGIFIEKGAPENWSGTWILSSK